MEGWMGFAWMIEFLIPRSSLGAGRRDCTEPGWSPRDRSAESDADLDGLGVLSAGARGRLDRARAGAASIDTLML